MRWLQSRTAKLHGQHKYTSKTQILKERNEIQNKIIKHRRQQIKLNAGTTAPLNISYFTALASWDRHLK
jgi:hypothetical protein